MVNNNYSLINLVTNNAQETTAIGLMIGKNLNGGEVIQLVSDLGGGKTTLTKGIVKGIGSDDIVVSPTFTVQKDYVAGDLAVHHFDFYRLGEAGVVGQELQEYIGSNNDIIVIEWGDIISEALPEDTIIINIDTRSDEIRSINVKVPNSKIYILKGLR